jgi:hypothetical protein
MAQFKAFAQGVDVNGESVFSVVEGMGTFKAKAFDILSKNGISQPKAGEWYSQQAWLNGFREISETVGASTLFLIGKKIPENAQFPPDIDNIEKALQSIDVAYHMNHRLAGELLFNPLTGSMKEGIGHYVYVKMSEKKAKIICNNPYPCDFDRGIIEAMAKRFKPFESLFAKVAHDDAAPCRKKGADSCTYFVEW